MALKEKYAVKNLYRNLCVKVFALRVYHMYRKEMNMIWDLTENFLKFLKIF